MIDHVSVAVSDLPAAGRFYDAVLAPLGLSRLVTRDGTIGYGKRYPEFWLNLRAPAPSSVNPGAHVCLRAPDEQSVRRFHATAVEQGAINDGEPGPRPAAVTDYFGAFILDLDGNKIETLTFLGTTAGKTSDSTPPAAP